MMQCSSQDPRKAPPTTPETSTAAAANNNNNNNNNNRFQEWAARKLVRRRRHRNPVQARRSSHKHRRTLAAAATTGALNHSSFSQQEDYDSYAKRKQEWANRYTNVESLRQTFGTNRNKVWGDLDPPTARRLYKTLLPTALLELTKVGVHSPEELAPLSYQARVAAKLYARERCQVPGRVFSRVFDGWRQFSKYGKFQMGGMSYEQVWDKYHQKIQEEQEAEQEDEYDEDEDVTSKICLRILERSCQTNPMVDRWVLPRAGQDDPLLQDELRSITETLESDVRKLLEPAMGSKAVTELHADKATIEDFSAALENDEEKEAVSRLGEKHPTINYRIFRMLTRAQRRAKLRHALHRASQQAEKEISEKDEERSS